LNFMTAVGVGAVAVGGVMFAVSATTTTCHGATRSAKLQWEQRERLVEQAYWEDLAYREQTLVQSGDEVSADDGERE
jgi:hypothetical protein